MQLDIYYLSGKRKGNVLQFKELIKIEIRCSATKRFLFEINIEEYYKNLKKMGVDITTPLRIKIPCQKCKMIEEYEIYPSHYTHIKSYKRES